MQAEDMNFELSLHFAVMRSTYGNILVNHALTS